MSLCPLSPRNLARINRQHGTVYVHASAESNGHVLICVDAQGRVWRVDRHDGTAEAQDWDTTTSHRIKQQRAQH